ncbi:MAG TPA: hypothetical protein VLM79_30405 [Kofleriaceae bacterium]|nr:hypothetical protein [Kofleriaceae bacterium]
MGKRLSATDVEALDAAFRGWEAARDRACNAPPRVSAEQLPCLEGVLDRFELLRKASVRVPGDAVEAILAQRVDPAVCLRPAPAKVPQLTLAATPQLISAYILLARAETADKPSDAELTAQLAASAADPCARVVSTLAFSAASSDASHAHALMIDAATAAEQCGDMRLSADLKIQDIHYHWEWPIGGRDADHGIAQAEGAAARVMQPELQAALATERRSLARQRGQWEEAFAQSDLEIEAYRERGLQRRWLQAVIARNDLRLARSQPFDLDAVVAEATYARAIALDARAAAPAAELDRQVAEARFWLGDPAAGAAWSRLWRSQQRTTTRSRRTIHGIVLDEHGAPVAGANVAAANLVRAASLDIGSPLSDSAGALRVTTTDAAGRFAIDAPPHTGAIVAQRADQRSHSAEITDGVRLVLRPTRRVTGRVDLGGTPYTQVSVRCVDADDRGGRFRIVAPLRPDGSFAIEGATTRALKIGIATRGNIGSDGQVELQAFPASRRALTDVELAVPESTRTLDVMIRSAVATRLEGAQVVVVPGRHRFRNFGDIIRAPIARRLDQLARPVLGASDPHVSDRSRAGDFSAHVEHVPPGELTVCALGFSGDLIYPQVRTILQDHVTELTLDCKRVGPEVHDLVIAVPPQRRFES